MNMADIVISFKGTGIEAPLRDFAALSAASSDAAKRIVADSDAVRTALAKDLGGASGRKLELLVQLKPFREAGQLNALEEELRSYQAEAKAAADKVATTEQFGLRRRDLKGVGGSLVRYEDADQVDDLGRRFDRLNGSMNRHDFLSWRTQQRMQGLALSTLGLHSPITGLFDRFEHMSFMADRLGLTFTNLLVKIGPGAAAIGGLVYLTGRLQDAAKSGEKAFADAGLGARGFFENISAGIGYIDLTNKKLEDTTSIIARLNSAWESRGRSRSRMMEDAGSPYTMTNAVTRVEEDVARSRDKTLAIIEQEAKALQDRRAKVRDLGDVELVTEWETVFGKDISRMRAAFGTRSAAMGEIEDELQRQIEGLQEKAAKAQEIYQRALQNRREEAARRFFADPHAQFFAAPEEAHKMWLELHLDASPADKEMDLVERRLQSKRFNARLRFDITERLGESEIDSSRGRILGRPNESADNLLRAVRDAAERFGISMQEAAEYLAGKFGGVQGLVEYAQKQAEDAEKRFRQEVLGQRPGAVDRFDEWSRQNPDATEDDRIRKYRQFTNEEAERRSRLDELRGAAPDVVGELARRRREELQRQGLWDSYGADEEERQARVEGEARPQAEAIQRQVNRYRSNIEKANSMWFSASENTGRLAEMSDVHSVAAYQHRASYDQKKEMDPLVQEQLRQAIKHTMEASQTNALLRQLISAVQGNPSNPSNYGGVSSNVGGG